MSATDPYTVRLTPEAHAYVQPDGGWCLNNAGFISDGESTLLIDTAATERRARALREAVLASGVPLPRTVVNTHHHGDHTYGNGVFLPEAMVIGHDSCRSEVLAAGHQLHLMWPQTDFGDIMITAPTVTYNDRLTVHVGDIEVRLIHPGVAHTIGDTIVHLPRQRVVFTGDLIFQGGTPFVPMGSLSGSLRALEVLRSLDATTVVPGHGPITDPSAYEATERYLRYVAELAQEAYGKGRTPLEAAREADLGVFAELRESERLVANLHRAYAELDGKPAGSPLDAVAVFADMAVMNGGVPVACHA
ncbi:MBL fold metallo-hydrolase [Streptomyces lunaelactis]|uniref:MBL fold metallo-hydrolase n=1 Tax=Streptomyces lunaelactis TaxID=1535768 RepID=UPI0015849C34|nr:MBL fold metallo-hydrolase [Streptomyces lunaelactis]NUK07942.1 MBL fold metallo-hydrolase [Streptomyces lunaelactis]NUK56939.1 MBL fold metallo-hydrolase [Streptomyces lunaelactis]NUK71410.1 MBL fold metallo-hydrolase [Streptomyces lunaelactis]NUK81841.1 MBL fold metallo-hydrolase [Streptomyces lunaelactis]NUL09703.1 MBL fold metallo-hydrolase [Streptomyces lunaelactis]